MRQWQLPLWNDAAPRRLKRLAHQVKAKSRVFAAEDIHFADGSVIPRGTPGRVESGGEIACNVKFEGDRHLTLCFWSMLAEEVL